MTITLYSFKRIRFRVLLRGPFKSIDFILMGSRRFARVTFTLLMEISNSMLCLKRSLEISD